MEWEGGFTDSPTLEILTLYQMFEDYKTSKGHKNLDGFWYEFGFHTHLRDFRFENTQGLDSDTEHYLSMLEVDEGIHTQE